jgi:serine/threonine protein kinase
MNVVDISHQQMLLDEVKAASAVQHPNLLSMKDYGEGVKTNTRGETKAVLYIVLELCLKESLFDFVT